MHYYVTLSNEMHNKDVIPIFTTTKASSYKVRLCFIVLSVAVCTVGYVYFVGIKFLWILLVSYP